MKAENIAVESAFIRSNVGICIGSPELTDSILSALSAMFTSDSKLKSKIGDLYSAEKIIYKN